MLLFALAFLLGIMVLPADGSGSSSIYSKAWFGAWPDKTQVITPIISHELLAASFSEHFVARTGVLSS